MSAQFLALVFGVLLICGAAAADEASRGAAAGPSATDEEKPMPSDHVQSFFYKARSKQTGNMWDVWLYHHEGTYYLYSLCAAGKKWDNFSMAKSSDGVHWTEIGPVLAKDDGVTWMGTGST